MHKQVAVYAACLSLGLTGCESFFIENPNNCLRHPTACSADQYCDPVSQSCQTRDCTVNTSLCQSSEYCNADTHRCTVKDCVIDASLCSDDQRCNSSSRRCEAITFVLGQPDNTMNEALAFGMDHPEMVRLIADPTDASKTKLLVSDSINRRVLVWNTLPTSNRPADVVFGAPDVHTWLISGPYGGINESSIGHAWGVSSDGYRLVLGDAAMSRVLIWNSIPTQMPAKVPIPANRVWGQTSFLTSAPDGGQADANALGIRHSKVFLDRSPGIDFHVSDTANNRVLVFQTLPGGPTTSPSLALGQSDFKSNLPGLSANGLRAPRDTSSDGVLLWVADAGNQRVLGYPLPISPANTTATVVIGQPNFTTAGINGGGLSASSLSTPNSLTAVKNPRLLFVADGGNHRVLRYTLTTSLTTADLVLGQSSFDVGKSNRDGTPGMDTLSNPAGVDCDGTHLVVGDYGNNRVLLWRSLPSSNGQPADVVLGQPNGRSNARNNPPSRGPLVFSNPQGVSSDGTRLFVSDSSNHRVLIWNRMPTDGKTAPDVVLGQPDFSGNLPNAGAGISAAGMNMPQGLAVENGRLAVADRGNNRVLIWNQLPTTNNQPADLCLGQVSCATAMPGAGPGGLRGVSGVMLSGGTLYVADTGNNRVLLFTNPNMQTATASRVLGQPNLTSIGVNTLGQSARTLAAPQQVRVFDGKLFVADTGNHRVLLWPQPPTQDGQAAQVVIGQAGFGSSYNRPDRTLIESPTDIAVQGGHLYISSQTQARILYWAQIPTQNGQPADRVLGQTDFSTTLANNPELPPLQRLTHVNALWLQGNRLFLADAAYNRIVLRGLAE